MGSSADKMTTSRAVDRNRYVAEKIYPNICEAINPLAEQSVTEICLMQSRREK